MAQGELITDPGILSRFWAKVDIRGDDECWPWIAGRQSPWEYGVFHPRKPQTVRAHRASLAIALGRELAPRAFVCHHCDNPPCVNPVHLYEGSSQSNVLDAVSRKRHRHGGVGAQKLTDGVVLDIRIKAASGIKNRDLASLYGLAESTVSQITTGHLFASVGGPRSRKYKKELAAHG